MTLTLTNEQLYIGIIVVLVGIQIYQQRLISKLEKETTDIWNQIGVLVTTVTAQLLTMQKDINNKQDKQ